MFFKHFHFFVFDIKYFVVIKVENIKCITILSKEKLLHILATENFTKFQ